VSERTRVTAVVSRQYMPAPDSCVRAVTLLLQKPTSKMAAGPIPEPHGHDDTGGSANDRTASNQYT